MFKIISDLGADLPNSLKNENSYIVNQTITLDGYERMYDLNDDKSMYLCFEEIERSSTFATKAMTYQFLYDTIYSQAKSSDLLCMSFSQRLSGTGMQMQKVCEELDGKFGKVKYFDTKTATVGQGILLYWATICQQSGKSMEQTIEVLDQLTAHLHLYVLLDINNHFFSGGRCQGRMQTLPTYPLLYLPISDLYRPVTEFFSYHSGINFLEKQLKKQNNAMITIGHGNNIQEANDLAARWQHYAPIVNACYINPVMGAHTGRSPILVAYLEEIPLLNGLRN